MKTNLLKVATTLAAGVMLAIVGSSTAAYAQDATETLQNPDTEINGAVQPASSTKLEGSWLYTVTIPGFTFQGIETYSAGGGYVEADQLSFSPLAVASAGHGAWRTTGQVTFALTYLNITFDAFATGNPTGTLKVRQNTVLDKSGNTYSGSGDYTYYDLNGNPIPSISGTFTITAKRIFVEAPTGH